MTGGTGVLGRRVVAELARRGDAARVLSRRPAGRGGSSGLGGGPGTRLWAGDLVSGAGVEEAVAGVDAIVHCATGSSARTPRGLRAVDVGGTRRLLAAARRAGVRHLVYPSIVGIDRVPFFYYRAKLDAEREIAGSGLAATVARLTQFHTLVLDVLRFGHRGPLLAVPSGFRVQPLDVGEAARWLADLVAADPVGRAEELGGPEDLGAEQAAAAYLAARAPGGRRVRIVPVPVPGRSARAVRDGGLLCDDGRRGAVTFESFVGRTP